MLDKIRLHDSGTLPPDYVLNLGEPRANLFDALCCRFLGVTYSSLKQRVLAGGPDDEILAWAHASGGARTDDECNVWSRFLMKIGWRDDRSDALQERVREYGLEGKSVETFFDLIDHDEGRDPAATQPWR